MGKFCFGESQSRLYPHMRAKFGRGPSVVSKKGSLKFISRLSNCCVIIATGFCFSLRWDRLQPIQPFLLLGSNNREDWIQRLLHGRDVRLKDAVLFHLVTLGELLLCVRHFSVFQLIISRIAICPMFSFTCVSAVIYF